ncbi:hypothetical protein SCHPADRAFT_946794 [Schizopora paradoxa]|uniref:Uncharacterized protein n=1 Tax=Schizopora paradoxa TaxID=27342 RepID=A0A0H2R1I7_9AGAM|nr:hypothetical protein SCHPADRAFT_946794 [Schizopora paradoxa]
MADKKSGAQRPSQRRNESVEGEDHVPAKAAEATGRTGTGNAQASAPSGSFVYPVRSLLASVAREGASGQDATASTKTVGGPDDLLALGKKEGISIKSRVARTPDGSVVFPQFAGAAIPSMSIHADDNGEGVIGKLKSKVVLQNDRDPDEYDPRHPEPISSAGASILAATYANPPLMKPHASHASQPLDFSKTGIVHLPPLPSSGSERSSSTRPSVSSRQASRFSSDKSASNSDMSRPALRSPLPHGASAASSSTDSESDGQGRRSSSAMMSSGSNSADELVTQRLQSETNDHGNFIITGREGKLVRCEDEPIRAPGSVQGFGVLIAVEEDDETGNLVVRQVSENASELLGLSPEYLFSLDCFTQTLPDSQSDLLWDNVQFLHDSEFDSESELNDSPQVFLLSGWGEPNSAISDDEDEQGERNDGDRRFWTCWCAAHRPAPGKSEMENIDKRNTLPPPPRAIIILEFELERDILNPLYPPFQHEQMATASPDSIVSARSSSAGGSVGTSAGGSGSSTATTLSFASSGGSLTETARTPDSSTAGAGLGGTTPANVDIPPNEALSTQGASSQMISINPAELFLSSQQDLQGDDQWFPSPEDIFESTTSHSKPLKALERMRRINRTLGSPSSNSRGGPGGSARQRARARRVGTQPGIGTMDIFAVLAQINDQLASAPDLESFLKVVVGVVKDLTQFHRVLIYQFDDAYNGQVVAELVDWRQTHDLYKGLHFPASDIPAQARELYRINKVRLLYNRSQTTARLVVRSREDLDPPLDMTHSFLRAMSPFHMKYLENMGVRSSMSISIVTFGTLWGLISCHSYGINGMRVSFPVRQMLRLLSDSVSRNIERLSYAQRLRTRKLISTLPTDSHPTGYIVSNAEDLVGLFDADFGVLVIGEGAKILGPNEHGQEILLVAEYLRLKQFNLMQVSQSVVKDFPDLRLPSGLEVIAGILCVPLARGGKDFIAFLRKGQLRDVHWAGKPMKQGDGDHSHLEPRKSSGPKVSPVDVERGQMSKWRQLVSSLWFMGNSLKFGESVKPLLTNLLLSNASHEVRTPLNHIINYLEMALNGSLDIETRENLRLSHSASKSLLFTINDLLVRMLDFRLVSGLLGDVDKLIMQDLTRLEIGNETSFNEPFDLHVAIADAVLLYRNEATRRNIAFNLDVSESPRMVIGDAKKIRTVVSNLTANAVKYTEKGSVTVSCQKFQEPRGLRNSREVAVEIVVADTGCGIEPSELESIFREFEQVESSLRTNASGPGLGLGLAVVARIVEQLGGQLRVDSKPNEGSRFSFLIPFELVQADPSNDSTVDLKVPSSGKLTSRSRTSSKSSEIDSLVEAISSDPMKVKHRKHSKAVARSTSMTQSPPEGSYDVADSRFPIRSVKVDEFDVDKTIFEPHFKSISTPQPSASISAVDSESSTSGTALFSKLRILVVEDDHVNRAILVKRLALDGHSVIPTTNGQEGVDAVQRDSEFDCVLMDIQMPVLNGFDAAKKIRSMEASNAGGTSKPHVGFRQSIRLNGRLPIFAVSASLLERQREEMMDYGMDGWILKPIEFKRLRTILRGIVDPKQRKKDVYAPGYDWESGGWLADPVSSITSGTFGSGLKRGSGSPP